MRILVVKSRSDVSRLLSESNTSQFQTLERFNPHLNLKKLKTGSVIVVPDSVGEVDFPTGDPKSIAFETMDSFIDFAKDALNDSSTRMKQAADRAKSEEASLATATKSKGVKEAVGQDPPLKVLVDGAVAQAKADSSAAAADVKAFDALSKEALAELSALQKRLA